MLSEPLSLKVTRCFFSYNMMLSSSTLRGKFTRGNNSRCNTTASVEKVKSFLELCCKGFDKPPLKIAFTNCYKEVVCLCVKQKRGGKQSLCAFVSSAVP